MSHGGGFRSRLSQRLGPRPAMEGQIVSQRSRGGGFGGRGFGQFMKQMQGQQQRQWAQMQQQMARTQRRARKHFDIAESKLKGVGESARLRATQQGEQLGALAEQDLISRGLGNTTVRTNVQRGVASDTERSQQGVDEMIARLQSNLSQQRGQFELQLGQFGQQGGQQFGGMEQLMQLMQMMMQGGGF